MSPTSEDIQRYIRISIYGMVGFLSGHGIDQVFGVQLDSHFIDTVLPIALFFGNVAWSFWGNRINAKLVEIAKYANDPRTPVKGVIVSPTQAGREISKAVEGPVVVQGTVAAKEMAGAA